MKNEKEKYVPAELEVIILGKIDTIVQSNNNKYNKYFEEEEEELLF